MRALMVAFCGCALLASACNASSGGCNPPCAAGETCFDGGCFTPCVPSCAGQCFDGPDGCGGSCPTNQCQGCCDATFTCQPGTSAGACGNHGEECTACDGGSCTNNQCAPCAPTGGSRTVSCGPCATMIEDCPGGGAWVPRAPGCATSCNADGCCDLDAGRCVASDPGTDEVACGNHGGLCQDCAALGPSASAFVCAGDAGEARCVRL